MHVIIVVGRNATSVGHKPPLTRSTVVRVEWSPKSLLPNNIRNIQVFIVGKDILGDFVTQGFVIPNHQIKCETVPVTSTHPVGITRTIATNFDTKFLSQLVTRFSYVLIETIGPATTFCNFGTIFNRFGFFWFFNF